MTHRFQLTDGREAMTQGSGKQDREKGEEGGKETWGGLKGWGL